VSSIPRVSVVIPVFNLRDYLGLAIESALDQTLAPEHVEVIVVDDGSTDGSGEVAERYSPRVRYARQDNRGLSAARNAGIRLSRGSFIAFLDADDRMLPEKLEAQLAAFASHPEVGLVYSGWYYVDEAGARLPQRGWSRQAGDVLRDLVLGNLLHPHAALVRRALVEQAGGFDETLTSVEDWDLWLRISRRGCLWHCVDRPLIEYRIRQGSMHQDAARMLENRLRVLDKLYADPDLPAEVARRRSTAYQNAYLTAACDFFRASDRRSATRWFYTAVALRPAFVTEPSSFRLFCRWVLPPGYQREEAVVAHWRLLAGILHTAVTDLYARPDLEESIRRLRPRAALAYWRTVVRLVRKRTIALLWRRDAGAWRLPAGAVSPP